MTRSSSISAHHRLELRRLRGSLQLLQKLSMVGGDQIDALRGGTSHVVGHVGQQRRALFRAQLAQILDDHKFAGTELEPLDLVPGIPGGLGASQPDPGFPAMIGFSVSRRAGQDFGSRRVRTQVVEELVQKLCRQNKRFNPLAPQRPLDRLVVHVVIGRNRTVVPKEPDPTICPR